jgi:hypothetical protein
MVKNAIYVKKIIIIDEEGNWVNILIFCSKGGESSKYKKCNEGHYLSS